MKILLTKVQHVMCEPFSGVRPLLWYGPVDRPKLHNSISIEILPKKVRHKKCDPVFGEDRYGPVDTTEHVCFPQSKGHTFHVTLF